MDIFCRIGGVLLCLGLSGCAGMHLYSEKRDQQGKDLKAAWAKVDLNGYFVAMHAQRKKLLQADLDAIGGARSAEVDSALVMLADARIDVDASPRAPMSSFRELVKSELDLLGTDLGAPENVTRIADYESNFISLAGNRAKQASYRKLIIAEGVVAPSCNTKTIPGAASPNQYAQEYMDSLAALCSKESTMVQTQKDIVGSLPPGALKTAAAVVTSLEQTYDDATIKADEQMALYRVALAKFTAAAASSAPGAAPSQALTEAAKDVRRLLALLGSTDNVLGNEAAANERIARIDGILAKLGTSDDAAAVSRGELAAVLVTRFADDAQVLADLNKPLVPMSLLIQRDLEKNRADLARLQADLYRQDLVLARAEQASLVAETSGLQTALTRLGKVSTCYRQRRFLDAVVIPALKAPQACDDAASRGNLYDAAGRFLHAIGDQRGHTLRLAQLRRDLKRERQIAYAQANAEQWAVLIDATAGQAVAWSASGQKASDYNSLIQSLSLLWIGNGVSK